MTKQALIVFLVGVNLFLLGCLLLSAYTPPLAIAQEVAEAGNNYILVAAEAERDNDAVYLIDVTDERLYAFRSAYPRFPDLPVRISLMDVRDLKRDFR